MGRTRIRPRTPLESAEFCARHDCPKNAGALFGALSADGRIHCGRKASASSPPRITEITVGSLARLRLYRHTSHSATGRLGGSVIRGHGNVPSPPWRSFRGPRRPDRDPDGRAALETVRRPSAPESGGRAGVSICPARTAPDGGSPGAVAGGPAGYRAGGDCPCD